VPGWYDDPWDPRGRRWWDGTTWSGYTDAWFAGTPATSVGSDAGRAVQGNVGVTRALGLLLPLLPFGTAASLATSSSSMRDLFRQLRDGTAFDPATTNDVGGWMVLGQLASLLTVAVLVLRMIWVFRATQATRSLGFATRRSAGWACAGWLIPVVNLWWPYQAVRDASAGASVPPRTVMWWWLTYLVGSIGGGIGVMVSWALPVGGAVVAVAVPTAFSLVSAVLERKLVVATHADLSSRVGLTSA
jgi:Domain of unknown function (DUF4328)